MRLTFYSDPGHGWLEVPMHEMRQAGLNPTDFSRYSYRKRNVFYLEEDCDAPKFIGAAKAKGLAVSFVENNAGAFIRDLPRIHS